jgi:hypothetical protein
MLLTVGLILFVISLHSQVPKAGHSRPQSWTETDSETLWRVRYRNCDYGYSVTLAPGVVGHGNLPPNPNHGFLISLPDVGRNSSASNEEERYVWVDASYDVIDDQSLEGAAEEDVKLSGKRLGKLALVAQRRTRLAGLPARWNRVEHASAKGVVVDESVIAVRLGIVYTIGLTTLQQNASQDENQFRKILDDFHFLKLRNAKTASFYCPD